MSPVPVLCCPVSWRATGDLVPSEGTPCNPFSRSRRLQRLSCQSGSIPGLGGRVSVGQGLISLWVRRLNSLLGGDGLLHHFRCRLTPRCADEHLSQRLFGQAETTPWCCCSFRAAL